ncbi:hypothetical protein CAT56_16115, partial [Acinetobacter nosocomialis]
LAPKLCLKFEWIGENSAFECLCNKAVSLTNHDKKEVVKDATTKKLYRLGIWRTRTSIKSLLRS